jgi:hypothetical protein
VCGILKKYQRVLTSGARRSIFRDFKLVSFLFEGRDEVRHEGRPVVRVLTPGMQNQLEDTELKEVRKQESSSLNSLC